MGPEPPILLSGLAEKRSCMTKLNVFCGTKMRVSQASVPDTGVVLLVELLFRGPLVSECVKGRYGGND